MKNSQEELKPIHKFNSGLGATLCNKCYVIISKGLTEELFCEKCKPKQETLEEVAEKLASTTEEFNMFIAGAKCQQEQDKNKYSEEEVLDVLIEFYKTFDPIKNPPQTNTIPLWFEKFKKKA